MIIPVTAKSIVECVNGIETTKERMVFIVGKPGSGKSNVLRELSIIRGWKYIESKLLLTEEFLELAPQTRAQEAAKHFDRVFEIYNTEVILLDGVQLLFAPILQLDPMELLRRLSRKYTIVAAWPGNYAEGKLIFSYNSSGDCRQYDAQELKVIQI